MPTKKKTPEQEMADLEKNWYETARQFGHAETTGDYLKICEESDEALDRWLDLRRELGDVALLEGMGTEWLYLYV